MIALFTPVYFNEQHTTCAREYFAMQQLEQKRLQTLPISDRSKGLIIPIVLRGEERLPAEIKATRQYYNFEKYALCDLRRNNKAYRTELVKIAQYVFERYQAFYHLGIDLCKDCLKFKLPTNEEIKPWLRGVISPPLYFERM